MKNLGKILTGIATSLALGFNTYDSKAQYAPRKDSKKIEAYSEKLGLNNHDGIRFITCKSEEEGIKDIREIAKTFPHEEIWLYLPELEEWHEIGVKRFLMKNEGGFVASGVGYDFDYVNGILNRTKVGEIIFYHNHPLFENIRAALKETNPVSNEEYEKSLGYPSSLEKTSLDTIIKDFKSSFDTLYQKGFHTSAPSSTDLKFLIKKTSMFSCYKVKDKICSADGVTEFYLTERGINLYNSVRLWDSLLKDQGAVDVSKDGSISIKNDYLIVNFEPFEKKED